MSKLSGAFTFVSHWRVAPHVLAGVGLFAATVWWSASQTASSASVRAVAAVQPAECVELSSEGCALPFGVPVTALLLDYSATHTWFLSVPESIDFMVGLVNQPGQYTISLYGPDDTLIDWVDTDTGADPTLTVAEAGPGTYAIVVGRSGPEAGVNAYVLLAIRPTTPEPVIQLPAEVDPYSPPPPRTDVSPYGRL